MLGGAVVLIKLSGHSVKLRLLCHVKHVLLKQNVKCMTCVVYNIMSFRVSLLWRSGRGLAIYTFIATNRLV